MGEELHGNHGWELQTGTRASQSHTVKEKPPHLQSASSRAPVHPSGQCCSHRKQGGSPGASQGHNYRRYSTFPEHLAEITELQQAATPHKHLLPHHSWNSHFGTTVGMFYWGNSTGARLGPIPWPFPPLLLAIPTLLRRFPKCHTHVSVHIQTHLRLWGENDLHLFCFIYIHILNFNTKEKKLESDKCLQTRYLQIDFTQFSLVQSK